MENNFFRNTSCKTNPFMSEANLGLKFSKHPEPSLLGKKG